MIPPQELRELRLFKEASANAVARLAKAMREKVCKAGELILQEGDPDAGLHLIAAGTVAVRKHIDKKQAKVVAHLGKGEFFGEMSLIDKRPASAEVVAETDARLFVLTRTDFEFLMSKAPTEALEHLTTLITGLSSRLRQTTRELVTLYQVARNLSVIESSEKLGTVVTGILAGMMGEGTTIGLYLWNPYNDEYDRACAMGSAGAALPGTIEKTGSLKGIPLPAGDAVASRCDLETSPQALFVYFIDAPHAFEPGDRQMMETVSSVLAPAFQTARAREEERARRDYQAKKQSFG